jgi:sensor histidine kinase YesM
MEIIEDIPVKKKSGTNSFILICLCAALPVYWAALYYIEMAIGREDEQLAVTATACYFCFFYIGWCLPTQWAIKNKKRLDFLFSLLAVIIAASFIFLFVHIDFPLHSMPAINLLLYWLPFFVLSLAMAILLKLFLASRTSQLQQAHISAAQSLSELRLLQSQLSPHFLFNTLNNLYGLSITQHDKIPVLLLKLSDLLRYSVYDAKELFVPLKNELEYINNYIDFEKIRIGDRLQLSTSMEPVTDDRIKIAPMLLIVFIENAFKHSKNTLENEVFIDITLKTWGDSILFSVKNSYSSAANENNRLRTDNGLGLVNVRKRLQLLYAGAYDLKVTATEGFFTVMLQLKKM